MFIIITFEVADVLETESSALPTASRGFCSESYHCVITGLSTDVSKLRYYSAYSGIYLPTFRYNLPVSTSRGKKSQNSSYLDPATDPLSFSTVLDRSSWFKNSLNIQAIKCFSK